MKSRLRVGRIDRAAPTRLSIVLSAELKARLERYAELHAQTWGDAVNVAELIPHMLQAFIDSDKAFRNAVKRPAGGEATPT
jgi:hypothetical protein